MPFSWEAFWGAMAPVLFVLFSQLAIYFKAKVAAASSDDASSAATGAHAAADARLEIAKRMEAKLDAVIASQNRICQSDTPVLPLITPSARSKP